MLRWGRTLHSDSTSNYPPHLSFVRTLPWDKCKNSELEWHSVEYITLLRIYFSSEFLVQMQSF